MLEHGGLVGTEPFAATHLGERLPAFGWLAQIAMAEVRLLWGWTGLRVFDALCWLGGFLVVAVACRRRDCSAAGVLLGLAIAFYVAFPTASIRPQSFAVLCFGVLLALLRLELRPWRTTLFAVPLFLLWQNLHPSISVAAVALGAHAAIGWGHWLLRRGPPPWEITALVCLASAAMLATPDGWSALHLAGENARASAAMGVTEWLPLWHSVNRGGVWPILFVIAVTGLLLVRHPRRIEPGELAVAVVLLVMTAFATRFVLFWAMALIPVIARMLPSSAQVPTQVQARMPAVVAPLLFLATAVLMPLRQPTHFIETIPLAAIGKLHDQQVRGTIFTHIPWGGPAIDIGYPGWHVAYDGRFYRYTPEEWAFYRRIDRDQVPLAEVLRRYRPIAFVLDPQWNRSLIGELRADHEWEELSADRVAVAFKRRTGATP
ncbi:MAG: hypothetical protein LBV50_02925 [Novosphingobium sp.]|nr:hypothetical protein [Novosphingobium sp.]